MGRRRTVAVLAGALVALAASVAVLAAPGGGAEQAQPLAAAADTSDPEKAVKALRELLEVAISVEKEALGAEESNAAARLLAESIKFLTQAIRSDFFGSPMSLTRPRLDISRAITRDEVALGDLASEELGRVKGDIRRAIEFKERALSRLPVPADSGCKMEQSTTEKSVSITVTGCKRPLSTITIQFPKPITLTGSSPTGKVSCKQVTKTAISCLGIGGVGYLGSTSTINVVAGTQVGGSVVTVTWKAGNDVAIDSEKPVEKPTSTPALDKVVGGARAKIQAALELEQPLLGASERTAAFERSLERSLKLLEEARDSLRGFYESFEPAARAGYLWVFAAHSDVRGAIRHDQGALWSRLESLDYQKREIQRAIEFKQKALAKIATRSAG